MSEHLFRAACTNIKGTTFFKLAILHFGSWKAALADAGIFLPHPPKKAPLWTQASVIAAIKALSEGGFPLNHGSMRRGDAKHAASVADHPPIIHQQLPQLFI